MNLKIWALATTLLFSLATHANQLPDKPHIYVEGSAEIEIKPDLATFFVNLEDVSKSAEQSKSNIDGKSVALVELCKTLDIHIADIAASSIRVTKEFEYDKVSNKQVQIGVKVTRSVEITLRDLTKYKTVMHELVASEISENIHTQLSLSDEKMFTDEALAEALIDATKRAHSIASVQGVSLGKLYSVSEFNLRQPERYLLKASRSVVNAQAKTMSLGDTRMQSDSLQRASSPNIDPFDAGSMKAIAEVYVVFLIK